MFQLTVFLLLSATAAVLARDPLDHPNVVVIYLDDSGYGDYSHNGNPVIETPNISKLAANGVNFTQFYVTSPACSASRYSLLTGRYPGRSGLDGWVVGPESKTHLCTEETTLAEGLKSRGYATGMFGKWHLGTPNEENAMSPDALPLAHGFDTWVGTNVSHDYDNAQLLKSDPAGTVPIPGYAEIARNLPSAPATCNSLTDRYTRAAVDFIRANRDRPFLAYVAHNQPHLGLYASEAFKGKSRRGLLGDVMAEVDDSVGRIIKALEENGVTKNTLVIFASDNGPWIKFQNTANDPKYGEARLHIGYAQPFRDGKGSNWEGGHRVPGIFYWPGIFAPKRQLEPASTLDVLPTVFALCGAAAPANTDGRDIRPLLASDQFKSSIPPFEFAYSGSNNMPNAWRSGPWKLHIRLTSQTGDNYGFTASHAKPLLFNVEQDLGERIDRAAEHPEIAARLLEKLDTLTTSLKQSQAEIAQPTSSVKPPVSPGVAGILPAESKSSLLDHAARPFIFSDPDFYQWGGTPVLGQDGRYHMFYDRWPRANPRGMKGWLYITEIAHAVADKPEGPYQFKDVALHGPGNDPAGRWDAFNTHNACCVKMPDETGRIRYFLYFIANTSSTGRDSDWMDHVMHQRIGVAVADSPDGPWERHPEPVCVPQAPLCHYVVNPGVTHLPGGRYLMVLKGRADDHGKLGPMLHGWALADKPTGPFIIQPSLLFPVNISAEDPCVWLQDGRVYAAVKDWQGGLSGTPGISWVYGDFQVDGSITWKTPKQASISPRRIRWADGTQVNLDSLERPFILLDAKGRPSHLFAAAAVENPFADTTDKATGKANAHLPFNLCLPLQPAD